MKDKKIIAIGSDHAGLELKEAIKKVLSDEEIKFKDYGTHNSDSTDYPDYAVKVALAVAEGKHEKGILFCGSGIGASIVANKIPGIRAALCSDVYSAKMSRLHNDANILALGGRVIGKGLAEEVVKTWLKTKFSNGENHKRRIAKIKAIEEKYGRDKKN